LDKGVSQFDGLFEATSLVGFENLFCGIAGLLGAVALPASAQEVAAEPVEYVCSYQGVIFDTIVAELEAELELVRHFNADYGTEGQAVVAELEKRLAGWRNPAPEILARFAHLPTCAEDYSDPSVRLRQRGAEIMMIEDTLMLARKHYPPRAVYQDFIRHLEQRLNEKRLAAADEAVSIALFTDPLATFASWEPRD